MKSRTVEVCNAIMHYLVEHGFTNQVLKSEVERAIILLRGPDKRTIKNWMRALIELGFLERISPVTYKMNLLKVPELLTNVLKGDKQKKLM